MDSVNKEFCIQGGGEWCGMGTHDEAVTPIWNELEKPYTKKTKKELKEDLEEELTDDLKKDFKAAVKEEAKKSAKKRLNSLLFFRKKKDESSDDNSAKNRLKVKLKKKGKRKAKLFFKEKAVKAIKSGQNAAGTGSSSPAAQPVSDDERFNVPTDTTPMEDDEGPRKSTGRFDTTKPVEIIKDEEDSVSEDKPSWGERIRAKFQVKNETEDTPDEDEDSSCILPSPLWTVLFISLFFSLSNFI